MPTIYKLHETSKIKNKKIFVDANVLIYLFWSVGKYKHEQKYASAFKVLLKQRTQLFIDFLVVSEIINRIIKFEHQKINPTQSFKAFRNSQKGRQITADIYLTIRDVIFSKFNIIGKSFSKQDIESNLVLNNLDFVDKAIVQICRENDFVLLTNDSDFRNTNLDILTYNYKLLK